MTVAIAHHPYEATREDEISFEKGEVIKVTDNSDPDWWVGKKKDGGIGFFPRNFVDVQDENQTEEKPVETVEETEKVEQVEKEDGSEQVEEAEEKKDKVIGMARVMEDYAMQEAGEISLPRGGIINVYEIIDDHWARGELNGKVGRYPTKFVEDIDMPGRPDFGRQASGEKAPSNDEPSAGPKGGFKLAAFGVKQGGIGSLLAGGFPGLKKTGGIHKQESKPEEKKEIIETPVATAQIDEPVKAHVEVPPVTEVPVEAKPPVESKKSLAKAIVLHPYDADGEDELNLIRGGYIEILERDAEEEGWWRGRDENGQEGIFPSNYVKELEQEVVNPPTPRRSRPSSSLAKPPQVPRPSSVQTPSTSTPIALSQRPSSVQVMQNTPSKPFKLPSKPILEESSIPEQDTTEQVSEPAVPEEDTVVEAPIESEITEPEVQVPKAREIKVEEPKTEEVKVEEPKVEEVKAEEPKVEEVKAEEPKIEEVKAEEVKAEEPKIEEVKAEEVKAEEVKAEEVKAEEVKVEEVEEPKAEEPKIEEPKVEEPKVEEPKVEEAKAEEPKIEEPKIEEPKAEEPKAEEPKAEEAKVEEAKAEEPKVEEAKAEEPKIEEAKVEEVEEAKEEPEEKAVELDVISSGPKLTTPSRVRLGGRARRTQAPSSEPSQTEILQKEVEEAPEEEAKKVSPAKPVKPIFAKFPTPFAIGSPDEITKRTLKPTRRLWDEKPAEEAKPAAEEEPVRPTGVKNIASRFNFNNTGTNDVLETKLKNHTKHEVEKVKKEFEALLLQEKEKRLALESLVQDLLERVQALEK